MEYKSVEIKLGYSLNSHISNKLKTGAYFNNPKNLRKNAPINISDIIAIIIKNKYPIKIATSIFLFFLQETRPRFI